MKRKHEDLSNDQLGLALTGEDFARACETRGLFSLAYLLRRLKDSDSFAPPAEADAAYGVISALWRSNAAALRRQNEAFTCSAFIEPLLDALGWHRIPEQAMPTGFRTRKRPDYCLFTDDSTFQAAAQSDPDTLFRMSATVLEAKRWDHPLDRLSSTDTPGWFPSQQVQDYLNNAKDAAGQRYFNWAILTNGNEWRLYSEHAAPGSPPSTACPSTPSATSPPPAPCSNPTP